ncbi:uncharacterized protein EI90DRAFT_3151523 [Cantharellus anzutake]|uniref:uncharacterized protein n=1 Tax=Cantharellus anzutake TaxID=1750568 RepID=UPI00190523C8|nr:uncharacterized protein EI90DRAFT_3151523 [Cantharellus anzutake]KAF8338909.1 hypothetical protein EI90DRAFT_3151523 [Cantharellus anzutake]
MFSTKTSVPTGMMTISPAPAPENTPASIPTVLADILVVKFATTPTVANFIKEVPCW